ncbi:peptidase M50 [Cellulomonas fimi ATCC 484]|uniref:Zinc metalloprotease n=1 Tax=Cellulomonas fimi (strain ATCC 484 / DSM 20113 / JCM 1341 / CCUG 24087 / LMG 16345 / NBRC 15513 / NCIMB 8980 / NCTC 7547 / NRS-133) TaxID=590998 RepID=F4GYC9_CELFA|nr:peptidase M50 [Cellulomonas fimi ATCC 484]VEH30994.1 Zn-dependent proteases [Cellulomonas fimi]
MPGAAYAGPVSDQPRPARRTSGWVVGRVAGAPIVLAPSWVVAAVVLTVVLAPAVRGWAPGMVGARVYVVALVFVVLLFASVLVHEIAHGLVARARGQQPQEFVLTLLGGHTSFGAAAATPGTNALVAVAGPVANLVLAGGFLVAGLAVGRDQLVGVLLLAGAFSNGFVGLFNLLPGLPLDGGAVLQSLVWAVTGRRHTGTVVAAWCGRLVAVGVFAVAFALPFALGGRPTLTDAVWGGLIGAFIWSGASGAIRAARTQDAVDQLTVERVGRRAAAVGHTDSVAQARAVAAAAGAQDVVVLAPDGRPAAYVDVAAASSVPADLAGTTPVTTVAVTLPGGAVVDGTLVGPALLDALGRASRHSPVVVAVAHGRVVGLVRVPDVVAALRA